MRQGIGDLREVGFRLGISTYTASLAAALDREGAIAEALAMVGQALHANPGQLAPRPEMLTLRGELWVKQGQPELAEEDFREAIVLAQKMGAKTVELQATTSLAGCWYSNAVATRRARCSPTSTAGSPKASTPPT
jgi:hypothetical protein